MRKSHFIFLLVISVLMYAFSVHGGQKSIYVTKIIDGDSIKAVVQKTGNKVEIRLWGIDAPEWQQRFSAKSRAYLRKHILKQKGIIRTKGYDKYGRMLGILYFGGAGRSDSINQQLVENGLAWVYRKYCDEAVCKEWIRAQRTAKSKRKGLWKDENPVSPWEYKRRKRKK